MLEDEGRYNMFRQKEAQYVYVVSEGQSIQPPTTTVGQVERDGSTPNVSVLYILDRQNYPLNFLWGLC
jgi:hypothetical protein